MDPVMFSSMNYHSAEEEKYSQPMPWIGMYIAFASLCCVLAIVADLIHGFRNRKLWFPCKYFTLNAASITVIAIAMKLPVDLNNSMPGYVDQAAKLGSMAFMCTMMASLSPSLATMDNKELLTNVIALGVLVITLVVNVCIQINTGVIGTRHGPFSHWMLDSYKLRAMIYVAILLLLFIIQMCSALTLLKSKQILESKYQAGHETALKDLDLQRSGRLTVEKLKQHITNHWIMAGTCSPQFITACSAPNSASGVFCALSTAIHVFTFPIVWNHPYLCKSDYKGSMLWIFTIQSVGVMLGTIAPLFRCFADLNFKLSIKWIWNHIKVFKVESYWTQKLYDWKNSSIPFSVSNRKIRILIQNFKILILSFCIGFQKTVVISCKMIAVIPLLVVIFVLYCIHCWKWIKGMFSASDIVLGRIPEQLENNQDRRQYVLQLQDDMEVAERTLKGIIKSMNRLIQKAEKQQPKKLIKLLEESSSRGFEGVGKYDSHHFQPLTTQEYLDCWSLALVTLTTIAISLPNIKYNLVDRLMSSVSEGLAFVTLVEESLNATDEYVSIHKAAKTLWLEVEVYNEWLGNKLKSPNLHFNTARVILQWFKKTAKKMVIEAESMNIQSSNDDSNYRYSICANSMYRITKTMLLSYQERIDEVSQEKLFLELSSIISDILAACFTNLPQVIIMKCHTSVIEKREKSAYVAAQLLGQAKQIINSLQDRELPSLNQDELLFIDKWNAFLQHPMP